MTDYSKILESLSPEKRKLLEQRLKQKAKTFNSFPLSYSQERLWFLDQLYPGSPLYNIPTAVRLKGPLNYTALTNSVNKIIERHESLRTRFILVGDNPVQSIATELKIEIPLVDLSGLPEDEKKSEVIQRSNAEAQKPFNLSSGPLIRLVLLKTSEEEHVLLLTMHHIISDGWSVGVFINEVGIFYNAEISGQQVTLPKLPIQYADYAVWQKKRLSGEIFEKQMAFWRDMLGDNPPALELPTDKPRTAVKSQRGQHIKFTVGNDILEPLKQTGARQGATLFMTMLAAFQTMLYRYSGQDDICVGTPIANRDKIETRGLIGFFINTLAIRSDLSGSPTFIELLKRVKSVTLGALSHQDIPFEKLVEELQPERDMTHTPFFQVLFTFQNIPKQSIEIPELTLEQVEQDIGAVKFDLTININENPSGLNVIMGFNEELFNASTIERFIAHFKQLLQGIAQNPQMPIDRYPLLSASEKQKILFDYNQTDFDYPQELCAHQLFEAQAEKTPEAQAVVFEDDALTYRQLNARANQIAHFLREKGVGPECYVGLCMDHSIEMLIAVLAVNKAGGAYVPIDPNNPIDRQAYILEDAGAAILLTHQKHVAELQEHTVDVVCINCDEDRFAQYSADNPHSGVAPVNIAYLIYTSGSTGKPKGVMIKHQGLVSYLKWFMEFYRDEHVLDVPMITRISFDISVKQYYGPITTGGRVIMVPEDTIMQPEKLIKTFSKLKHSCFNSVPSLWRSIIDTLETGHTSIAPDCITNIVVGGEPLDPEVRRRTLKLFPAMRFFNVYGPTEATATATYSLMSLDSKITIGRPLGNYQIYILDPFMEPAPFGVTGELYIGGVGVARGYLERPDLTAEKFVPDPFGSQPGARLYRTGDLARMLPDGKIEFVGRIDFQVKIRGFRIELGEIEVALARHPALRQVIVLAREDKSGNKRLVAYAVPESNQPPAIAELKNFLRESMPDYMVPSAFVFLDKIPLTRNGKIDRRALPEPELSRADMELDYVAPRNQTEEIIALIFSDVLNVKQVGALDNFFELGGHSLIATQIISRIRDRLSVELPLRDLFQSPTVEGLAAAAEKARFKAEGLEALPIVPVSRDQKLPLSFAQQRMWFLDQLEPGSPLYNIPNAVRMSGSLDIGALQASLNEIIRRHEILRTSIATVNGEAVLHIENELKINIPLIDLSQLNEEERQKEISRLSQEEATKPFRLDQAPLLRATLLKLKDDDYIFLFTMHHIVSDGWSTGVLIKEIVPLYSAFRENLPAPLPPLKIQYADFAHWQRHWLSGEVLEEHIEYWRKQLGGAPPYLELPTDRPRPAVQTFNGARKQFFLSKELTDKLKELTRSENATLFMTLLAAYQTLLYRYSGQDDISVGTPIAGRNRSEIEPLIGFFVNTLVMRSDLSGNITFRELLKRVSKTALGAFAHQDLPFEKLIDLLNIKRDVSRTPLFQTMFALQNIPKTKIEMPGLTLSQIAPDNPTSKFELTLEMAESHEGVLSGVFEYNTDLFEPDTIERFIRHFTHLLKAIVHDPQREISRYPLMDADEVKHVVRDFNALPAVTYAEDLTLPALFERQVLLTPQAMAVSDGREELSFKELNERANRLAHYLLQKGLKKEGVAALYGERNVESIIFILAILKAGGAYLPVDPSYPPERIAYMLEDSKAAFLLARSTQVIGAIKSVNACLLALEQIESEVALQPTENPEMALSPENLAYIIYTSGSTGKPKGVMIQHRSPLNLAANLHKTIYEKYGVAKRRISLNAPLAFDASVQQIVMMLHGHPLVIIPKDVRYEGQALLDFIRQHKIELLDCVPSQLKLLIQAGLFEGGWAPADILPGGEAIDREMWRQLQSNGKINFYNMYGPTECTVDSTMCPVADFPDQPTIGRPVANSRFYVLDENLQPLPIGVTGELHIAGHGLGRGYLNRPELTAEKFLPDPFSDQPGARMYKTGDLACFNADGSLTFKGRVDFQVKLRGFRIELGEIESALSGHAAVEDAQVMMREDTPGHQQLTAYILTNDGQTPGSGELRNFLGKTLPEYMIPVFFVPLSKFPLTPNGKIDRKALPLPEINLTKARTAYVPPANAKEEILARIWQEILGVPQVGIRNNFFELGGDSILSIQVIARARQRGLQITPVQIFKHQTIGELAAVASSAPVIEAEQGIVTGDVPLTPIQKRFFEKQFPNPHHWNQSLMLEIKEKLQADFLKQVVEQLITHHDALRLRFKEQDGQWKQWDAEADGEIPFSIVDLSAHDLPTAKKMISEKAAEFQTSLNLGEGPVLRVVYFDLGEKENARLLMIIHHLAMDGVSWRIFMEDLQNAYLQIAQGKEIQLPPKTTSFKEWAEKISVYANSDALSAERSYWQSLSQKTVAPLPVDFANGINDERAVGNIAYSLSEKETKELLQDVPPVYNTQINDILLTALARAFSRWTGKRSLLLNLEGHGREDIFDNVDISRTIGWFTAVYPVFLDLGSAVNPGDAIKSIKEQLKQIPAKGLGFGLLRYLNADENLQVQLKTLEQGQVTFNYLGQFDQALPENSPFIPAAEGKGADHDPACLRDSLISVSGSIAGGRLHMRFSFSENLYRKATIDALAANYMDELRGLIQHCNDPQAGGHTASDFELAKLDNKKLDKVMTQLQKKKRKK